MDDLELLCNLMFARSIATGHALTVAEAAQTFAEAYDEQRAELARLQAENERLRTAALNAAESLSMEAEYCEGHARRYEENDKDRERAERHRQRGERLKVAGEKLRAALA